MDYTNARKAMVDSQIHPMGVSSDSILDAFLNVPREEFVPDSLKSVCYCDEDIKVSNDRYLMDPSVLARMVQKADLDKESAILTIGSGIGYNAAILSHLSGTVVALEENQDMIESAQATWDKLGYSNIAAIAGDLSDGAPKYAPYDAIFFNGAIHKLPDNVANQLKVGGKLLAIIRKDTLGLANVMLYEKTSDDNLSGRILFEAGTPFLKGFEPEKTFVF